MIDYQPTAREIVLHEELADKLTQAQRIANELGDLSNAHDLEALAENYTSRVAHLKGEDTDAPT